MRASSQKTTLVITAALALAACTPYSSPDSKDDTLVPAAILPLYTSHETALAATCSGCHAAGNAAMTDFSAYTADTLQTRLLQYKHENLDTVMHRIARGYTEEQLTDIAAYLTATTK